MHNPGQTHIFYKADETCLTRQNVTWSLSQLLTLVLGFVSDLGNTWDNPLILEYNSLHIFLCLRLIFNIYIMIVIVMVSIIKVQVVGFKIIQLLCTIINILILIKWKIVSYCICVCMQFAIKSLLTSQYLLVQVRWKTTPGLMYI